MDLFGLKAHEEEHRDTHLALRRLVEQVSQLTINLGQTRVELRELTLKVEGKVAVEDVDPAIIGINEALANARVKLAEVSASAEENWNALSEQLEDALEDVDEKTEELAGEDDDAADDANENAESSDEDEGE